MNSGGDRSVAQQAKESYGTSVARSMILRVLQKLLRAYTVRRLKSFKYTLSKAKYEYC